MIELMKQAKGGGYLLQVKVWGEFGEDVAGQLIHHLLLVLASSPSLARQCQENAVKQLECLLLVLGDISILMETKDLWVRDEGQGAKVLNVGLVLSMWRGFIQATRRESVTQK